MSSENDNSCSGCLIVLLIIGIFNIVAPYVIEGGKWVVGWGSDVFSAVSAYTSAHEAEIGSTLLFLVKATVCAGALVALIGGALVATINFIISLRHLSARPTRTHASRFGGSSPAFFSYYYWKGDWIINLREIVRENYLCNKASLTNYLKHLKTTWGDRSAVAQALLFLPYLLPVTLGMLLRMLMLVVGFLIFMPLVAFPVVGVGFGVVILLHLLAVVCWLAEKLYEICRGYRIICPQCGKLIRRPSYSCPGCNKTHTGLFPSPMYGIFRHTCGCGTHLPTSRFFGRLTLKAICPGCYQKLPNESEVAAAQFIAFAGGPGSGKTTLLAALLQHLAEWQSKNEVRKLTFPYKAQTQHNLIAQWKNLSILPTASPTTYGVEIKGEKTLTSKRIYLHDAGGHDFENMQSILTHSCYRKLGKAIFVIDPFSFFRVREYLQEKNPGVLADYRVSAYHVEDIFAQWLLAINTSHKGGAKTLDCAFVLTKASTPFLQQFGEIYAGCPESVCRSFLESVGAGSILAQEDTFKSVRYFALDAQGNRNTLHSGISELLEWVLSGIGIRP